jgi:N6-adenosine-specific RNA methylase IME4
LTDIMVYDEACRMLAQAAAVDEVLDIRNKAEALRKYAQQAKNRDNEIHCAQIRVRAERRLGELIIEQRDTVGLAKGGTPYRDVSTCSDEEQVERLPTLAEAGIDRKLSSRAQRIAELGPIRFEALMAMMREQSAEGRVIVDILKIDSENEQRTKRRDLARELSKASRALSPYGQLVPCIYADPPWKRDGGVTDRSYENHYGTMTWDEICAMPVKQRLLPDAWLFLWVPRAHMFALHLVTVEAMDVRTGEMIEVKVEMPLAWAVAKAWGFEAFSTAFVWTKTDDDHPLDQGGGVLVYDQDEVLLMFKRGRGLPKPATNEKYKSNHRSRKREHSRKPEYYREMICSMTGGVPVLELFARVGEQFDPLPPDWLAWGNQAAPDLDPDVRAPDIVSHETDSVVEDEAAPIDLALETIAERVPEEAAGHPALQTADEPAVEGEVYSDDGDHAAPDAAVPPAVRPGAYSDEAMAADHAALSAFARGDALDADVLADLRERKLVTGKAEPRLTKDGTAHLTTLDAHFDHLAQLELLPSRIEQLVGMYGNHLFRLNERVLAGDADGAKEERHMLDLLQERANGNTTFGMACDDSPAERLRLENRAPAGAEPMWCQYGVWRVVVDGIPHLLQHDDDGGLSVYAEDAEKSFLSETGFRSFMGSYRLGCTVGQRAELLIREHIDTVSVGGGPQKPRTKKTAMTPPDVVYRLPNVDEDPTEPVWVEGSIFKNSKPAAVVVGVDAVAVTDGAGGTRYAAVADDEAEFVCALQQLTAGDGGEVDGLVARDLIGAGYATYDETAECAVITAEGLDYLRHHEIVPAASAAAQALPQQIDIEDLLSTPGREAAA